MSRRASGRLRIIGGARKGRLLRVPVGETVRPTGEKVREAVFDVLGPVAGLTALDLFAGTGAMGLEALSRGAARCVFVESDTRVAGVLRENIAGLGYGAVGQVIGSDYVVAAQGARRRGERFDLLFVDPPYRMLAEVEVMLSPVIPDLLADDGVVVVEGAKSVEVSFSLDVVFDRTYGDTKVTMIKTRRTSR